MRTAIIINPASGRASNRRGTSAARAELARHVAAICAPDAAIVTTEGPGHAAALAEAFVRDGTTRVVAWGGDGTINEVAGPLIGTGVALGIVPGGSGDGTAGSLGVPRSAGAALELALTGSTAPIDVGWLGDRHFLNVAGIGFDGALAEAFNRRNRRGLPGYLRAAFPLFWTYRPHAYRLSLAGEVLDGEMMFVGIANGRQYGNGLVLAPGADPSDGWLDVAVVWAASPLRFLWQARLLVLPTGRPTHGVDRRRARDLTVAGERLVCHVDGESFSTAGSLSVRLEPRALQVAGVVGGASGTSDLAHASLTGNRQ